MRTHSNTSKSFRMWSGDEEREEREERERGGEHRMVD